ncbi:thymidine kinase [Sphaerisporangium krabiense]|uniref:Thymidine kinase n=1 Tax=Sphaerisporangium krabiense TaxID=763782 RepID=A0A7W8ZAM5_9ACTN|nr:thymidine kinase [Sphaerisporangium krabiense]MBB5630498.1 thymidine kinase [Sphaerisporangium krabiense]GII62548.1 thymidine kinase [Sphaerisporangium krabiense]
MSETPLPPLPDTRRDGVLRFFHGPMDCGKSTLALQMNYNHARQGRRGLVLTKHDRSGGARVTSRIGLGLAAIEVDDDLDLVELVRSRDGIDYLICDEACFYTVAQIEQLADLVDRHGVDVYAFGLASDFRSRMFPAAQRLFELADEVLRLQVEVLCWCGRQGRLNARIVDGVMARTGEQVVIADTDGAQVHYRVLCRRHYRSGDLGPVAEPLLPAVTPA